MPAPTSTLLSARQILLLLLLASLACPLRAQTPPPTQDPPSPRFEVASIRLSPPDHGYTTISPPGAHELRLTAVSMSFLIAMAFDQPSSQTAGLPAWAESTLYDVSARPEGDAGLTYKQLLSPLQALLKERFHLQTHREQRVVNGYVLVVAKGGSKLQSAKDSASPTASLFLEGLRGSSIPIPTLTSMLGSALASHVVDKTALSGNFDVNLKFANPNSYPGDAAADPTLPSIFTAVTEQLGLRLDREKIQLNFLVIDHVDKLPTEN